MGVVIPVDRLNAVITQIFEHTACGPAEARLIAKYLIDANLTGHDSHGVLRTSRYVKWLDQGLFKAGRSIRIVSENDAMAIIDGESGMGHWVANQAVNFGIEKAKANGCYIVALRNAGHIGRVGSWAINAAAEGLVSIHFANARGSVLVAPFGGTERRFSTAPFCVGVPRKGKPPVILDFATSIVAEGKVMVAAKGGKPLPEGALIDESGALSTAPGDAVRQGRPGCAGGFAGRQGRDPRVRRPQGLRPRANVRAVGRGADRQWHRRPTGTPICEWDAVDLHRRRHHGRPGRLRR